MWDEAAARSIMLSPSYNNGARRVSPPSRLYGLGRHGLRCEGQVFEILKSRFRSIVGPPRRQQRGQRISLPVHYISDGNGEKLSRRAWAISAFVSRTWRKVPCLMTAP